MLNPRQTDAFLAVAQVGSFDLAAQTLHITASAVTLRVQNLEKHLGHLLLVRDRPCRLTHAGETLLHFLQHQQRLEESFIQNLGGQNHHDGFVKLNIASNADSLATWLLPALQHTLIEHKISIHFLVDDQSQTHHLLEAGQVNACLTTQADAMKGCVAEFLGKMKYHLVATPFFMKKWFNSGFHRENLRSAPAVIFNEKDRLHTDYIQQNFGLNANQYPHHSIPSYSAFYDAIFTGLGFGWVPEFQAKSALDNGELVQVFQGASLELNLYWHHWKQQSPQLHLLTERLKAKAQLHMNDLD